MTIHARCHRTGPCTLPDQLTRLSHSGRLTRRFIDRGFFLLGKHGMLLHARQRVIGFDVYLFALGLFVSRKFYKKMYVGNKMCFLLYKTYPKHTKEYRKWSTKFSHGYEVLIANRSFMKSSGHNNDKGEQKIRTIKLCKKPRAGTG